MRGDLPTLLLPGAGVGGGIFHHLPTLLPPFPRQEPAWLSEEWPPLSSSIEEVQEGLWWFLLGPLASVPGGTDRLGDRVLNKLHSWGQGRGGSSLEHTLNQNTCFQLLILRGK